MDQGLDQVLVEVVGREDLRVVQTCRIQQLARFEIVTVEEAYLAGGFGSSVLELLEENGLQDRVRLVRMGIPDRLITHGDPKLLLAKYGLDSDGIFNRVRESIEVLDERRARPHRVHS